MLKQETLTVTCIGCNNKNEIPIDNLLDYSCITCGTSILALKETEQEILVKELDKASDELDHIIGNVMFGNIDPEMASNWLEHESGRIVDTLNKAKEYIENNEKME
ncbi:hypothetical protein AB4Z50_35500 [Paenibacillus sp. 2TAB26]|uniref:hypothetical protein n=1 Tax=Paenibacillus sp. 2TAB26 TaxID=3233005 RepID=UPI003F9D5412